MAVLHASSIFYRYREPNQFDFWNQHSRISLETRFQENQNVLKVFLFEPPLKTFIFCEKYKFSIYVKTRNMCQVAMRFIYLPHLDTNIYPVTNSDHPVQSQSLTRFEYP